MAAPPEGLHYCVCVCVCVLPVQEVRSQGPVICVSQFCLFAPFPPAALLARICMYYGSKFSRGDSDSHYAPLTLCSAVSLFVLLFERPFAQLTL